MTSPPLSSLANTPEQLEALLRSRKGGLEETPYGVLLLALGYLEKSAVLTLRRNQLQKEIVFDDGAPIECRSNIATETLGRSLVATGKISEKDCLAALNASAARSVPLEDVLAERKLVPPTELFRILQKNLGRKLLEPFSWKSGTWEISDDVPPVESSLRVKVPQLVITGILKVDDQESVDEALSIADGKFLTIARSPLFKLEDLRLTSEQEKVLDGIERGRTLDEIRTTSGVDGDDVNRIVYALLLLGVATVTDKRVRSMLSIVAHPFLSSKETEVGTTPAPVVSPSAPAAPPEKKARIEPALADDVVATFLAYRRKDPFELLGVTESDGPSQFTKSYLAISEKFLPSKFEEKSADGLRDKAQELFLAAARAYAELADPDRRDAVIKRRADRRKQDADLAAAAATAAKTQVAEPAKPKAARGPEKAAMIDPEALCQKGRELVAGGKNREALSYFEMAAECDAQNGTYAAEMAWCRYQLDVSPATTAIKLLKNAIRIDPRCGPAHLYAGRVQTALGNKTEAEQLLNTAAMLMPKDMRVVEALKALR